MSSCALRHLFGSLDKATISFISFQGWTIFSVCIFFGISGFQVCHFCIAGSELPRGFLILSFYHYVDGAISSGNH